MTAGETKPPDAYPTEHIDDPLFLYRVRVEFEIVVLARGADDARDCASVFAEEEISNQTPEFYEMKINRGNALPEPWRNAIPYKPIDIEDDFTEDEQDRTCQQWMALLSPASVQPAVFPPPAPSTPEEK